MGHLAAMPGPIVHLCHAATSGSSRAAINIARGSADASRHAYVLYGALPLRQDYGQELDELDCPWRYVYKPRGWGVFSGRRVARELLEYGPLAVVFHGQRSLPVAQWLRWLDRHIPTIAVHHGAAELESRLGRWVCRRFAKLARRNVTVSQAMADAIGAFDKLARACEPLAVIPNGLDVDFWKAGAESQLGETFRLAAIATIEPPKDHATLLRAVREVLDLGRKVELHVVGTGADEMQARRLARSLRLGRAARFHGDLTTAGVRHVLHGANALVHSTHRESFGMAVVEGMSAGRPVIATDVPGIAEIISSGETGLLVPDGDVGALAGAICRLIDDPQLAGQLAAAGQAHARDNFTCSRMARQYEELVGEVLAGR